MPKIVAKKEEWVKIGFLRFSQAGLAGINVEKMARQMKCNKSSFYWHFKTKKNFVDEVIRYWIALETDNIITATEAEPTAMGKFMRLIELTFAEDPYIDFNFYLKKLAQTRKDVLAIVCQVDDKRVAYVWDLFRGMGVPENLCATNAALFYKYLIGYHEVNKYQKRPAHYLQHVKADLEHFLNIKLT